MLPGPIDYRSGTLDITQFGQRETVADYILRQVFNTFCISCLNPHFIMHAAPKKPG